MVEIPYRAEQFPEGLNMSLEGSHDLKTSWAEICWSAITVGRPSWFGVRRHGVHSFFELVWRVAMVWANLARNGEGKLVRSPAYAGLDSSEKGGVSYFLGQTCAKLVSWRFFGVPWLLHLDAHEGVLFNSVHARSRPDFVGKDISGNWLVIESKGRSGGLRPAVMEKAKRQLGTVLAIDGAAPVLRVAVATYFNGEDLRMQLQDPPDSEPQAFHLEIDHDKAIVSYYALVREVLRHGPTVRRKVGGESVTTIELTDFDLEVGLRTKLLEATDDDLVAATFGSSRGSDILDQLQPGLRQVWESLGFETGSPLHAKIHGGELFPDGIYVKTGERWDRRWR